MKTRKFQEKKSNFNVMNPPAYPFLRALSIFFFIFYPESLNTPVHISNALSTFCTEGLYDVYIYICRFCKCLIMLF